MELGPLPLELEVVVAPSLDGPRAAPPKLKMALLPKLKFPLSLELIVVPPPLLPLPKLKLAVPPDVGHEPSLGICAPPPLPPPPLLFKVEVVCVCGLESRL